MQQGKLDINMKEVFISTTKGLIAASNISNILIHEHVFNKFPFRLREKSESFTINELENAYKSGVNVIVDLTPYTNPYDYYHVIDETKVSIVTCIGFYTPGYMAPRLKRMTESELFSLLSKRIEVGVGVRKIKPAILKVAIQKSNISDIEYRFLRVVSKISKLYTMPVALHAPFSTLNHAKQLLDSGVTPSSLMVAHIENGICKEEELIMRTEEAKKLASWGCFIQLADFGSNEKTLKCKHALSLMDSLLDAGYLDNVLISSDCNWRWRNANPVLRNTSKGVGRHYTYTITHTLPIIKEHTGTDMRDVFLLKNPLRFLRLLP